LALVPAAPRYRVDPTGIRSLLDQLARVVVSGYVILLDYGAGTSRGAVRTFAGHEVGEDLLARPGERDVTASVDWADVEASARVRGLEALGRRTQRQFLTTLGLSRSLQSLRAAELAALRAKDTWERLRMRDHWTRGAALIDPAGLGGFEVLVLGRGVPAGLPWE
jgi:SAM-dependent MidA family methyltransferase